VRLEVHRETRVTVGPHYVHVMSIPSPVRESVYGGGSARSGSNFEAMRVPSVFGVHGQSDPHRGSNKYLISAEWDRWTPRGKFQLIASSKFTGYAGDCDLLAFLGPPVT
jgi:hypothetical protein